MRRSSLLRTRQGRRRSTNAWRSAAWVWTRMPLAASMTMSAESESRAAAETSEQKSAWPGESIRCTRWTPAGCACRSATEEDFTVATRAPLCGGGGRPAPTHPEIGEMR